MNMDASLKYLKETEASFILNQERYLGKKGEKNGVLGKTTPLAANYPACEIDMPSGENYSVGKHNAQLTNELYDWVYNHNGVHFIKRITANGCEIVYFGDCLPLSADPKHSIEQWRAYLKVDKICANRSGKQLIWVNGTAFIGMLDTEAAIATNNFTTPFFDLCSDPCAMISMCVPDPCGCLKAEFIPLSPTDFGRTNNMVDVGIQISYRHVYYDGRRSTWADPSTMFYQDAKGCFDNSDGFPRCLKAYVPVGNPMVEKIEIAYSKDGIWYKADVVEKYKKYNSSQQMWYERALSEQVQSTLNEDDCTFEYLFCNDKQCDVIAPEEFNRVYNPMPRNPQGILNIEDALGFYNYIQGNCPIDKFEADKLRIGIACEQNDCVQKNVKIKVRAIIHNRSHGGNQFIYRLKGENNSPDDPTDTAYFGGLNNNGTGLGDLESGYDQYFREKTRNFIAYIEGTDYYATMKQWKAHKFYTVLEEWGVLSNLQDKSRLRRWRRAINNDEFFYQEAEITVPKGTRGFIRLASHTSTGNDQDKSTFVFGVLDDIHDYKGKIVVDDSIADLKTEEIYFDTCSMTNDTLEIYKAFVIDDNAVDTGLTSKSSSYYGYISDKSGRPVEGAIVAIGSVESITDHNGFYHLYLFPGADSAQSLNVKVEKNCYEFDTIETMTVEGEKGYATAQDYQITNEDYDQNKYTNVTMKVKDCKGVGVGGIRIALSGSKYKTTGIDGIARFKIRNYSTRDRQVRGIVLNGSGCLETDCAGNCQPCMATSISGTAPCYTGGSQSTNLTDGVINISNITSTRNGLKSGGQYPFGFIVKGDCGRQSAVYRTPDVVIPKTQAKSKEGFCSLSYDGTGMVFPEWGKCMDIVRGVNLNPFELQWVVDKIERTDDGKIKLTIQSLNDYNERFLFKTNTIYQWIKGDRIEFIKNGDGKIFSIGQFGLLNYLTISPFHDELMSGEEDAAADFFNQLLINDDGKLDTLKVGAVIELQRSKECTTEPTFFGICASIPIGEDGKLLYPTGNFHTFDTYFVSRKIGDFPVQKFEHHSPSDFWGTRLTDTGKPYFVNEYENEQRFGRNITINSPNEYNRFGDLIRTLKTKLHGDIIYMQLIDGQIGLAISEHDNSLFQASDDLVRIGNDGIARAAGADSIISDTQPKLSGTYGCQYPHIGSIFSGDGYVLWWDVNKHTYVKHDFQTAKAVDDGKMQNYFSRRSQEVETNNKTAEDLDKFRFATGYNNLTGAVILTTKSLRHSGIYNETGPFKKPNDTILFHPASEDFLGFASFTGEAYGNINLYDGNGCAFVTYLQGVPYIHPIIPEKYNEFFGVACDWRFAIALNRFPNKEKVGVSLEVQSETMFFVEEVVTDEPNYLSEIPASAFKKTGRKWNASFKGNINSVKGLFGPHTPRGQYISVLLVRDNTDGLKYRTIDNAKRVEYSELDLVILKSTINEQSGLDQTV